MKQYHLIAAFLLFFVTVIENSNAMQHSFFSESLGSENTTQPQQYRSTIKGITELRGKNGSSLFIGISKVIFDDIVKCVNNPLREMYIQCESFEGKGKMLTHDINIVADNFSFVGILDYSRSCTIITPSPVDQSQFSVLGPKPPKFIVDPDLPKFAGADQFIHFTEQGEISR